MKEQFQIYVSGKNSVYEQELTAMRDTFKSFDCITLGLDFYKNDRTENQFLTKQLIERCNLFILVIGNLSQMSGGHIDEIFSQYYCAQELNKKMLIFLNKRFVDEAKSETLQATQNLLINNFFRENLSKQEFEVWEQPLELSQSISKKVHQIYPHRHFFQKGALHKVNDLRKISLASVLFGYTLNRFLADLDFRKFVNKKEIRTIRNSMTLAFKSLTTIEKLKAKDMVLIQPVLVIIESDITKLVDAFKNYVDVQKCTSEFDQVFDQLLKVIEQVGNSNSNFRSGVWNLSDYLYLEHNFTTSEIYYLWLLCCQKLLTSIHSSHLSNSLKRELKFPPELQQAGIGVLNYFSVYLAQKLPGVKAGVSIRQEAEIVFLTIDYEDGKTEIIEKALSEFTLVASGKADPSEFLSNNYQVLAFKQKLQMAELELKMMKELLESEREHNRLILEQYKFTVENIISSKDSEIYYLRKIFSEQLEEQKVSREQVRELFLKAISGEEDKTLVKIIDNLVEHTIQCDNANISNGLEKLNAYNPSVYRKFIDYIANSVASGVLGNSAYDLIKILAPFIKNLSN